MIIPRLWFYSLSELRSTESPVPVRLERSGVRLQQERVGQTVSIFFRRN